MSFRESYVPVRFKDINCDKWSEIDWRRFRVLCNHVDGCNWHINEDGKPEFEKSCDQQCFEYLKLAYSKILKGEIPERWSHVIEFLEKVK